MRERWSSSWGFTLAGIGSAVGLGNIWRFPYLAGTQGGGAFLIPYLLAVATVGLPLLIAEIALGRHAQASVIPAFGRIGGILKWAGVPVVLITGLILSYYLVVTGWVLAFLVSFALGQPFSFSDFTNSYWPLPFYLATAGISFLSLRAGVRRGIERLCRWLVPLLFAFLLFLLAVALTLPGRAEGLSFFLTPDFSRLADPLVWSAAFGQSFYSLSVGLGIMLTYGSYMGRGEIIPAAGAIAACDTLVAVLAGFIIFPVVFSFGLDPAAGVELAFVTLPAVFSAMKFGGVVGCAFFLLLFFAALTSAISLMEVPVASLADCWGPGRKRAVEVVSLLMVLGGFPAALSYTPFKWQILGRAVLDLQDLAFGTFGTMISGILLSLVLRLWFMKGGVREGMGEDRFFLKGYVIFAVRFLIPPILLFNLAAAWWWRT